MRPGNDRITYGSASLANDGVLLRASVGERPVSCEQGDQIFVRAPYPASKDHGPEWHYLLHCKVLVTVILKMLSLNRMKSNNSQALFLCYALH